MRGAFVACVVVWIAGCGGMPSENTLRDSAGADARAGTTDSAAIVAEQDAQTEAAVDSGTAATDTRAPNDALADVDAAQAPCNPSVTMRSTEADEYCKQTAPSIVKVNYMAPTAICYIGSNNGTATTSGYVPIRTTKCQAARYPSPGTVQYWCWSSTEVPHQCNVAMD